MSGPAIEYNLTIEAHPGYLHARVIGKRTPQNALRFLEEVHEECIRRQVLSVLLEMNLSGPSLGISNIYQVVSQRTGPGTMLERIAYVEASAVALEKASFAETVAVNRGVNLRLFRDVEEARRWLTSG